MAVAMASSSMCTSIWYFPGAYSVNCIPFALAKCTLHVSIPWVIAYLESMVILVVRSGRPEPFSAKSVVSLFPYYSTYYSNSSRFPFENLASPVHICSWVYRAVRRFTFILNNFNCMHINNVKIKLFVWLFESLQCLLMLITFLYMRFMNEKFMQHNIMLANTCEFC